MSTVKEFAQRVAKDMDAKGKAVGIGWELLIPLVTPFITRLFQCGKDNDNVTPETASARIQQLNDRDPHRLRKRMTKNALRTHKGEITKQQAADMADSTIAVALEANPEEVAAMCNEILIQDGESADFVLE